MNIMKVLGPVPLKLKLLLVSPSLSLSSHIPPSPRLVLESQPQQADSVHFSRWSNHLFLSLC
jgi:hypothetical protein